LSVHHNLAHEGYIESTCCCVQARYKNTPFLVMLLLNNVFKALNLL
jgi:hypothetical protein